MFLDYICERSEVLTESRAVAKEEGIFAVSGSKGSRGASFCTSRASSAILRRVEADSSSPKETAWKDKGFLAKLSAIKGRSGKFAHPCSIAERQTSRIVWSDIEHSPSERKIMIGVLYSGVKKEQNRGNANLSDEPFCAPILHHYRLGSAEGHRKVCSTTGIFTE
jgi:hypothetical protein